MREVVEIAQGGWSGWYCRECKFCLNWGAVGEGGGLWWDTCFNAKAQRVQRVVGLGGGLRWETFLTKEGTEYTERMRGRSESWGSFCVHP